jgi:hypothetical protein
MRQMAQHRAAESAQGASVLPNVTWAPPLDDQPSAALTAACVAGGPDHSIPRPPEAHRLARCACCVAAGRAHGGRHCARRQVLARATLRAAALLCVRCSRTTSSAALDAGRRRASYDQCWRASCAARRTAAQNRGRKTAAQNRASCLRRARWRPLQRALVGPVASATNDPPAAASRPSWRVRAPVAALLCTRRPNAGARFLSLRRRSWSTCSLPPASAT